MNIQNVNNNNGDVVFLIKVVNQKLNYECPTNIKNTSTYLLNEFKISHK